MEPFIFYFFCKPDDLCIILEEDAERHYRIEVLYGYTNPEKTPTEIYTLVSPPGISREQFLETFKEILQQVIEIGTKILFEDSAVPFIKDMINPLNLSKEDYCKKEGILLEEKDIEKILSTFERYSIARLFFWNEYWRKRFPSRIARVFNSSTTKIKAPRNTYKKTTLEPKYFLSETKKIFATTTKEYPDTPKGQEEAWDTFLKRKTLLEHKK